jgi:hypothetical protein
LACVAIKTGYGEGKCAGGKEQKASERAGGKEQKASERVRAYRSARER